MAATQTRYFFSNGDQAEIVTTMCAKEAARRWPEVKALRDDSYSVMVGREADVPFPYSDHLMPLVRKVQYKKNPSKHECNAKCMGGKCGGVCECRCGGKNHGIGC